MTGPVEISGFAAKGYEAVRDQFAANFAAGEELGARFCAFCEGEAVVDIWAGWSDREKSVPWADDTLAGVFSSGKAAMAAIVAEAVSKGALDYERPVAEDWPAFGANGKEEITLAMALSHQASLCGFPDEIPADEWIDHDRICARLASMAPLWPPGSASGYHPQTIGYIVNELMRRKAGRTIGGMLREKGLDIHCGMRGDEIARAAFMPKPPSAPVHRKDSRFTEIAFLKPWSASAKVSREAWMAAEIPASNMHATARALAEVVHPLANDGLDARGKRVIEPEVVGAALKTRASGEDLVLPFHIEWAAGLMRNTNGHFGPSDAAFGHPGFGGSAAMVDPSKRMSAAYVMNKMSPSLSGDPRAVRLFAALAAVRT